MSPTSSQPGSQARDQDRPAGRRSSRWSAAWSVLRGERLTPPQIEAEWAEYQLVFGELLQRLSAMLARQAKYEKQRARRLAEGAALASAEPPAAEVARPQRGTPEFKAALRRRAFGMSPAGRTPPPQPATSSNGGSGA